MEGKVFCPKIEEEKKQTSCLKCQYYEDGNKMYCPKGCYFLKRTDRDEIDIVINLKKEKYKYLLNLAQKNYNINKPRIAQQFEIKADYIMDEIRTLKKEKEAGKKYAKK